MKISRYVAFVEESWRTTGFPGEAEAQTGRGLKKEMLRTESDYGNTGQKLKPVEEDSGNHMVQS